LQIYFILSISRGFPTY